MKTIIVGIMALAVILPALPLYATSDAAALPTLGQDEAMLSGAYFANFDVLNGSLLGIAAHNFQAVAALSTAEYAAADASRVRRDAISRDGIDTRGILASTPDGVDRLLGRTVGSGSSNE